MDDNIASNRADQKSKYLTGILAVGGCAILLSIIASPFLLIPAKKKLGEIPWMTTPRRITRLALSKIPIVPTKKPDKKYRLIDLGSGDGRVVIEAAKIGYHATGIELNPVLLAMSYYGAWRAGVLPNVTFKMQNFWKVDLKPYDVISIFGVTPAMYPFVLKVRKEANIGAFMICFRFPIKEMVPYWKDGELYVYQNDGKDSTSNVT